MKRQLPNNAQLIPPSAECVFSGILFDVYQWQQEMFDGSFQTFEMLRRPDSVEIIGIDEQGRIVTLTEKQPGSAKIRQHYLPGGRVDTNDASILAAAQRECREETGLSFNDWKLIDVTQPQSKIEWFVHTYIARDITDCIEPLHDAGEDITIGTSSWDEVRVNNKRRLDFFDECSSIDALISRDLGVDF